MIFYLQMALEDEWEPLIAAAPVDIARARDLLDTSGATPSGESCLEKAIEDSYRRHSDVVPAKTRLS